jgi:16S rRNA (guanine1207-N2)-methyltransferase
VAGQQYFAERPQAAHRPGEVRVVLPDVHLRLETDSGTFSPGRLDPGTRVLLDTVPAPPPSGDLLDLGCGYGPVALAMAVRSPGATVWAVDTNTRALELCRKNASRAGLRNVRCITPGGEEQAGPDTAYSVIWSNPPIRIGKAALHDLLARWLSRLSPGGTAYLVVHRNLGADSLHRWLSGQGWAVERVTSRAGYRVLRLQHPGQHPGRPAAERSGAAGRQQAEVTRP